MERYRHGVRNWIEPSVRKWVSGCNGSTESQRNGMRTSRMERHRQGKWMIVLCASFASTYWRRGKSAGHAAGKSGAETNSTVIVFANNVKLTLIYANPGRERERERG